jgi:aspartate racemase
MEEDFYIERLRKHHGLDILTPKPDDREIVHRIIYKELCHGEIIPASRVEYQRIMAGLAERGAEGIILGCTEISLLVNKSDSEIPLFDTTGIHARRAAELALEP